MMKREKHKILIVDDTPSNIRVLSEVLGAEYETFFSTNGKDAIRIARTELPDIILLDVMMPVMDGYEVCEMLKADPKTVHIPVIFVTAMGREEDETKGLELGAIDYVTKPISPSIVKARVRNHLKLKSYQDFLEDLSETATRAKNEFLANISHELRTPLNPILGMTDLILYTNLTAEQREYIGYVQEAAENLLMIVDDLIEVTRLVGTGIEPVSIRFNPASVLSQLTEKLNSAAVNKGLSLTVSTEPGLPDSLIGDPEILFEILVRLTANGIKFSSTGGVTVTASSAGRRGDLVLLLFSIKDTGPGIPPERLSAIVEDFTQADGSFSRSFGGLGIGLTITRKLVSAMGGDIHISSPSGEGTIFDVTLPFTPGPAT